MPTISEKYELMKEKEIDDRIITMGLNSSPEAMQQILNIINGKKVEVVNYTLKNVNL